MQSRIMYIESKPDIIGSGRIGRVRFSKSGRSLYYRGKEFRSLKGAGWKANYFDVATDDHYWVSNCRKDGQDTLYPDVVEIDDDVREEYWLTIRQRADLVDTASFRSEGKYTKRGPK